MKIIVTGGAGFIGSHLVDELIKRHHQVIIIDDLSTGHIINPKAVFIHSSITNKALLESIRIFNDVDAVYHLAALARIQRSWDHPELTYDVNVNGTLNILDLCRINQVPRVLITSSSSVFAGLSFSNEVKPISPGAQHIPLNPYAYHKHLNEELVRMYRQCWGMNITIARPFNVYGARQMVHSEYSTVIPRFADCKLNGLPLPVYGNGKQTRDFTHVNDVVNMMIEIIGLNEDFNLCSSKPVSLVDIAKAFNAEYKLIENPRKGEAQWTWGENNTGYKAQYNVLNWIKEVYA